MLPVQKLPHTSTCTRRPRIKAIVSSKRPFYVSRQSFSPLIKSQARPSFDSGLVQYSTTNQHNFSSFNSRNFKSRSTNAGTSGFLPRIAATLSMSQSTASGSPGGSPLNNTQHFQMIAVTRPLDRAFGKDVGRVQGSGNPLQLSLVLS